MYYSPNREEACALLCDVYSLDNDGDDEDDDNIPFLSKEEIISALHMIQM